MTAEQTLYMEWAEKMARKYPHVTHTVRLAGTYRRRGNIARAHAQFVADTTTGPIAKVSPDTVIRRAKDEGLITEN